MDCRRQSDSEKRVIYDARTGYFTIHEMDHTLGNLLCAYAQTNTRTFSCADGIPR